MKFVKEYGKPAIVMPPNLMSENTPIIIFAASFFFLIISIVFGVYVTLNEVKIESTVPVFFMFLILIILPVLFLFLNSTIYTDKLLLKEKGIEIILEKSKRDFVFIPFEEITKIEVADTIGHINHRQAHKLNDPNAPYPGYYMGPANTVYIYHKKGKVTLFNQANIREKKWVVKFLQHLVDQHKNKLDSIQSIERNIKLDS